MISAFIERVVALPDVDHLLLIYDGFSYAKASVIRAWQQSVQRRHQVHCGGASLQRFSRASINRQACCS